ncbi:LOW QUALITY PROTEIN: hypothetical protein PanWU01x14_248730 [Parasponia andersonii]|uniref:Uncharacterized protein n=1 Tax=Parasponia andersonii TaxID=3476 RepID=A0A2P5BDC5_PARAD|nr:LOW QUALITY PROTEIN: hypothetical protein PanWU01x14_248730 [Parasponia andersonii]
MPLYCDNQSAICLVENLIFHVIKYVEVHYHFLKEKVLQEELEICQVETKDQAADLFTKELNATRFQKLREQLKLNERKNVEESVLRGVFKEHHCLYSPF